MIFWDEACEIFDSDVFTNYYMFSIFIESISTTILCSDSDSIINKFALWIDGRGDFPEISNERLSERLKLFYNGNKYSFLSRLKNSLDEFKDCFEFDDGVENWGTDVKTCTDDLCTSISILDIYNKKLGEICKW